MKVFISWSGELSKQIAELLKGWTGDVLQSVDAWISTEDIDKGSIWFGEITAEFEKTLIGIICLTRENLSAPWILFEAGALSKGLTKSRVIPLLIDLHHEDLQPPLSQFNAALPDKADMFKLIRTINSLNVETALSEDKLQKSFERWWDEFDAKFRSILSAYKPRVEGPKRSVQDMVTEILATVRSLQVSAQKTQTIVEEENIRQMKERARKALLDSLLKKRTPPFLKAPATEILDQKTLDNILGSLGKDKPTEETPEEEPPS